MKSIRDILDPNSTIIFNDNYRDAFNTPVNYPELIKNELYNSYGRLTTGINRIIGTAAGIAWETHKRWSEFKSKDPDKYLKMMKKFSQKIINSQFLCPPELDFKNLSDMTCTEFDSFSEFVDYLFCGNYGRFDVAGLFYTQEYIDTVNELRASFYREDGIRKYINIDIENVHEFISTNITTDRRFGMFDALAFKIKPDLIGVDKIADNEISSIRPIAKYNVCIDMNKMILFIIRKMYHPDCPSEAAGTLGIESLDKDSFVTKVVEELQDIPDKFAGYITVDILDLEKKINSGWSKFIETVTQNFTEIYNSDDYNSISDLITHVLHRSNINADTSTTIFKMFGNKNVSNVETVENILRNMVQGLSRFGCNGFAEKLMESTSYGHDKEGTAYFLRNMVSLIFVKSFSIFFESATLFDCRGHSYYKPLDIPYDVSNLKNAAAAVSDYNIRDFFTNIISKVCKSTLTPYNAQQTTSGDLAKRYTLLKRQTWCWLLAYLNIYFSIAVSYKEYVSGLDFDTIEQNYQKLYNKLNESILKLLDKSINKGLYILSLMGNEVGAPYWNEFYIPVRFGINDKLFNVFKHFNDPTCIATYNSSVANISAEFNEICGKIKDFVKEKYGENMVAFRNIIISYDAQELGNIFKDLPYQNTADFIRGDFYARLCEMGLCDRESF